MSITLAFDAAVAGGSISLLDGVEEIAHHIGSSDISKAEALLININALLTTHGISPKDLDLVAVSAGPGSFTGIRIGLATAIGLEGGLGIAMTSVSALEALAATSFHNQGIYAVPMGRNYVCVQKFVDGKAEQPPKVNSLKRFTENVRQDTSNMYFVHENLLTSDTAFSQVSSFGSNVAKAVGLFAVNIPGHKTAPLFLSESVQ